MLISLRTSAACAVGPVSYAQGSAVSFTLPASWHRAYLANLARLCMLSKGIWDDYCEVVCFRTSV